MSVKLKLEFAFALHKDVLAASGGSPGVRDLGALESALAQPDMSFGGQDLYPTTVDKAAAVAYSLAKNHPFVDGNKRVAHGLMVLYLRSSGLHLQATLEDQEDTFLRLAAGEIDRQELVLWLSERVA